MKNILIIEYNTPVNFEKNNFSGTTKCGFTLFNYLNSIDEYNCYYAIIGNHTIPNIIDINNIDFNLNYDLIIINGLPNYELFSKHKSKFDKKNKNIKYICICHGLYYQGEFLNNNFDKCIYVSKFAYDVASDVYDYKKIVIGNPIDISLYKNLNVNDKHTENSIVISYNRSQGNIELFLDEIYPIIKKEIQDIKVYICEPDYNYDNPNIIRNKYKNDVSIIFLGNLDYYTLSDLYMKCPISWDYSECPQTFSYNAAEHLLCYTFITVPILRDAVKYLCDEEYINKHNLVFTIENKEYNEIACFIIDHINNYDKYKNDFEKTRNNIIINYNKSFVLSKYKNLIDNLIKN